MQLNTMINMRQKELLKNTAVEVLKLSLSIFSLFKFPLHPGDTVARGVLDSYKEK